MVEDHGGGENKDEPFDAEGEETGVLEVGVYGSDEDGAGQESSDEISEGEEEDGPYRVCEIGEEEDRHLRVAGVGGVERRYADDATEEDATPEDGAGDEQRRAV
jgi:hypothetical protein